MPAKPQNMSLQSKQKIKHQDLTNMLNDKYLSNLPAKDQEVLKIKGFKKIEKPTTKTHCLSRKPQIKKQFCSKLVNKNKNVPVQDIETNGDALVAISARGSDPTTPYNQIIVAQNKRF